MIVLVFLDLAVCSLYCQNENEAVRQDEMCWWYDQPATKFWEGLPIGTGRFAGMVPGETRDEAILGDRELPEVRLAVGLLVGIGTLVRDDSAPGEALTQPVPDWGARPIT